jgi:hypothetical protein
MARSWIKQPGPGDGVGIKVGELTDLTPIVFSPDRTVVNHVDAAIARVNSSTKIDSRFPNFGAINGTTRYSNIRTNILCQKFGRTTLRTSGKVLTTDALVEVEYGRKKKAWFDNQVFLEPTDASQPFCGSGDSGSLVVDMNMYALGLLFAGTNLPPEQAKALSDHLLEATGMSLLQFGVANPIEAVETALNIELM